MAKAVLLVPLACIFLTLVFWIGFASVLPELLDQGSSLWLWSVTLFLSIGISIFLVSRTWPRFMSATSIGLGYVLFGFAFCMLEGDTSKGTDLTKALVLYGTLFSCPIIACILTWNLNRMRESAQNNQAKIAEATREPRSTGSRT